MTKAELERQMRDKECKWLLKHWNASFYTSVERLHALKRWRHSTAVANDITKYELSTVLEWVLDNYIFKEGSEDAERSAE